MSTSHISDRDAFNTFIDTHWGGDLNGTSLEEALREFRDYQRELAEVQSKIEDALAESAGGQSSPMDDARLGRLFRRKDAELLREGIEF